MELKTNEFQIVSDDGQRFTVCEYQKVIPVGHSKDPGKTILGKLGRLVTDEGYHVNSRGDGIFQVVELDLVARLVE